ncbi:hypothetical protein MES4922_200020 [Mesorhizobium ventifaucium]|uniref:Uncharacterized protein n=1 Tax=Mesorhizobium ventifaucium TaxID=666020 RepID=A0ABM9DQI4_9HYPH|nr:hypothetical protein MES4922_200020 [Mesorhizobium ventifaucium]
MSRTAASPRDVRDSGIAAASNGLMSPYLVLEQAIVLRSLVGTLLPLGATRLQVPVRTHEYTAKLTAEDNARFSCRRFSQKQGDVHERKWPISPEPGGMHACLCLLGGYRFSAVE